MALYPLLLRAEHAGTNEFEKVTGQYFGRSQTKVKNQKIDTAWSSDETIFYYRYDDETGQKVTKKYALSSGKESIVTEQLPAKTEERKVHNDAPYSYENDTSPDKSWVVEKKDGEVTLRKVNSDVKKILAKAAEGREFTGRPQWSPDSSMFILWDTKFVPSRKVNYTRSSPKNTDQPEFFSIDYAKPGDDLTEKIPVVFYTDDRKPMPVDQSLIPNPFSLNNLHWRKDSQRLTFDYIERGFGKMRVVEMNAATGKQRVLINEESETFIYVYGYGFRYDLTDGKEVLWLSERDGWNHLYLMEGTSGAIKKQLTKGNWVVKKVMQVDEKKRQALLQVCGYYPEQDPYFDHYVTVNIDSGKMIALTSSAGDHEAPNFSPQGNYYVCRWSRIDHPPVYELRRTADGKLLKVLSEADAADLNKNWRTPEPFMAKDREGKFDIYGIIVRPPDFDPKKKYPIVEYIYAGPQDAYVKKSWSPWIMPMNEIASFGFIVVQIDGRGTAHRGKEFHNQCYKNLKDAGFPDRIAWMKSAAGKYPEMDIGRVGVFGGSAGGQNALGALLFHGDFYKAAATDCGCHDNRMDKIWWNEQWMDWPIGPEYADNSNVTHAKNLQGALFLTFGEVDTNVDPSSSMQVVNALLKADKDFEMYVVPNGQHGCGESRMMQRKRVDFFRKHLGGSL